MMLEGVIAGMVNASAIAFLAEADIEHRNTKVIKKGREVGTRTQCLDRKVLVGVGYYLGCGLDTFVSCRSERGYADFRAQPISYRHSGLRIDHARGHLVYKVLE